MSGQLVGEVLAAADELRRRGLTERGFHALIAIAEKCHTDSRQASVPWLHIRAGLFGASLPTAKRAVKDLRDAGCLRVVKRGFDNQHGRVCAPIYEIEPLGEQITQMSQSSPTERVTQMIHSVGGVRIKSGGRTDQIEGRTDHPGDPLNGSSNGPTNGGRDDEPRCARHRDTPRPPPCLDCEQIRKERDRARAAERDAIREAIDNCRSCDQYGRDLMDFTRDCPKHPNFLTRARSTA